MAKAKTTAFFCKECGYESSKWLGQCPACRAWNTLVEEPVAGTASAAGKGRMSSDRGAGRSPGAGRTFAENAIIDPGNTVDLNGRAAIQLPAHF